MFEIVFLLLIIATEVAIIRVNLSPLGECSFLRGIVHPRGCCPGQLLIIRQVAFPSKISFLVMAISPLLFALTFRRNAICRRRFSFNKERQTDWSAPISFDFYAASVVTSNAKLEPFEFAYLPRVRCTRIAPSTRSSHYLISHQLFGCCGRWDGCHFVFHFPRDKIVFISSTVMS